MWLEVTCEGRAGSTVRRPEVILTESHMETPGKKLTKGKQIKI
jgi:hypothetical protein